MIIYFIIKIEYLKVKRGVRNSYLGNIGIKRDYFGDVRCVVR